MLRRKISRQDPYEGLCSWQEQLQEAGEKLGLRLPNVPDLDALQERFREWRNSGDTPNSEIGQGIACLYFRLSEKWGIKLYRDEEDRDYAFDAQSYAASLSLGPPALHTFELEDCISMLGCNGMEAGGWQWGFFTRVAEGIAAVAYDDLRNLCARMEDAGFDTGDMHRYNSGYLDGKAVAVDFDPVSTRDRCF